MENSLRRIRKAAGYKSAKAFAEAIGMPPTTYSKYEQAADDGEISMPLKSAWTIADALGCTIDALVGREELPDLGMRGSIQRRYDALSSSNKELVEGFMDMIESHEERTEAQRKTDIARQYMRDARNLELQFFKSVKLMGDSDDVMFFGSDEDLRNAFETFAIGRIGESESKRVGMLCERARRINGDGFDMDAYTRELEKQADARTEEVVKGVMAAYDIMNPTSDEISYVVKNLE